MLRKPGSRPRFGDVVEFSGPKGLADAQYTHEHTGSMGRGSLLRVLPGLHAERRQIFRPSWCRGNSS